MRRPEALPLPLLLVSSMVVIGAVIEWAAGGGSSWAPELPLVALLGLAFLRGARDRPVERPPGS